MYVMLHLVPRPVCAGGKVAPAYRGMATAINVLRGLGNMADHDGGDSSRALIRGALLDLFAEKTDLPSDRRLFAISVTAVCKRAGVSRSTFYSYYDDVTDVMQDIQDTLVRELDEIDRKADEIHMGRSAYTFSPFSTVDTLRYLADNRRMFLTLLDLDDGDRLFKHKVMAHIRHHATFMLEHTSMPVEQLDIAAEFLTAAIYNADVYWLKERPDLSPEDMCSQMLALVDRCAPGGPNNQ